MRKFSILDENYMALEQSIAQALDTAEEIVRESKEEAVLVTKEYFSDLEENTKLSESVNYISYRNDELVESYTNIDSTLTNITESVKQLKTKEIFSLEEAAILSRTLREFDLTETEDEVDELGVFFGGKDNINIPDSDVNHFKVVVTEEGKRAAIDNYTKLRSITTKTLEEAYREGINESNLDSINEALGKLALLNKISNILK
jgi:hypothetical protein